MINRIQQLWEEFQSVNLAVLALAEAVSKATRFDRPGIIRALGEAMAAREQIAIELMDVLQADIHHLEAAA